MFDIKVFNSALSQLEEERGISREKILEAIAQAVAAAYKKDYGKKDQIVRADFDPETGTVSFEQVKIVVDESTVRMPSEEDEEAVPPVSASEHVRGADSAKANTIEEEEKEDVLPLFNPERHIMIEDAKRIKKDVALDDEMIFPLETKEDYGRIAAQTAKQVIIQKIREAEKESVLDEYADRKGEVVSGVIQRMERGNVFIDIARATGIMPYEEQIPGEHYRQGARVKAYIYDVVETPRGVSIRLSRTHPEFLRELFAVEAPEVANETVEIKSIAREPGNRSKIAVHSIDDHVDPIGACVGQRGVRVSTIMNELAGEKIDIILWNEDPAEFVAAALSPAKVIDTEVNEEKKYAKVIVPADQMSLAIGKGGQNARLAVKLTGWNIDIEGEDGTTEGEVLDEMHVDSDSVETESVKNEAPEESENKEGRALENAIEGAMDDDGEEMENGDDTTNSAETESTEEEEIHDEESEQGVSDEEGTSPEDVEDAVAEEEEMGEEENDEKDSEEEEKS
ncbi:MAG: transcription termination/antitermination protein NusA [Parcubacteria group bacterium]|nr:transcription termination/antitermination protein NusA [Parcubacteria group bacterium]